MCWKSTVKTPTFSIFPRKESWLAHELIPILEGKHIFPGECYFRKILVGKKGLIYRDVAVADPVWQNYPPNAFAWPIFSEPLKQLIQENVSEAANIDWIKMSVEHFQDKRQYYILKFNELHDVIDKENTLYVRGTDNIIRPCFRKINFDKVQIATIPTSGNLWKITSGVYVSGKLKKAIEKSGTPGIEFSKTRAI